MTKYTPEIIDFMRENAKGISTKELSRMVNEKFGQNTNCSQIQNAKNRFGIRSGFNSGRFQKGHQTWNKGMKGLCFEGCKATQFKKGNIPPNHREVGSERITKDGYIEVKVAEPNIWELKHRVVWEQHHGCKVPEHHAVLFLDSNKQNFDVSNLKLVTRAELSRLCHQHLLTKNPEANEIAITIANVSLARGNCRRRLKGVNKNA